MRRRSGLALLEAVFLFVVAFTVSMILVGALLGNDSLVQIFMILLLLEIQFAATYAVFLLLGHLAMRTADWWRGDTKR